MVPVVRRKAPSEDSDTIVALLARLSCKHDLGPGHQLLILSRSARCMICRALESRETATTAMVGEARLSGNASVHDSWWCPVGGQASVGLLGSQSGLTGIWQSRTATFRAAGAVGSARDTGGKAGPSGAEPAGRPRGG